MTVTLPPSGLAEDVLINFADSVAVQEDAPSAAARIETWVTFALAGETFALPVSSVLEILRVAGITRVPHAPRVVRGVTNMRGKVLPVVDLRVRLGMSAAEITAQSRILVASSRGRLLGLLVDAVQQVDRIDRNAVQPPPPDVMTAQSHYLIGVSQLGERLVILLDVDLVLIVHEAEGEQP
ncbi:MAG TPA: chemotaxis protein CheW [Thermoanaerobaculia bacterium]|nr:chemotaxis protein CheW [Thermoanaerobaculia bacterium]